MEKNEKGKPSPVDVYTLEVTVEQAEKLALVSSKGQLQFSLRNITDAEPVITNGATISQTLASLTRPKPKHKGTRKWRPRPSSVTVEVIKGNNLTKKKMKL